PPPAPSTDGARPLGADFWKFLGGQTISSLGTSFTLFALPLLIYELTGSAVDLAVAAAINMAPYLMFGLVIGAFVDRLDRRRLMIVTDVVRAGIIASIPLLASMHHLSMAWIYAVGFASTTMAIAFDAAQFAAIPSIVDKEDLVTANGRIQASYSAATVVGPLLAGSLLAVLAVHDLLLFDAASFLLSAGFLATVRRDFNGAAKPAGNKIRQDIAEGLRYIWSQPVLRTISLMMVPVNFLACSLGTQLVLFSRHVLHATNSQVGIMYSAGGAGVVVLSMAAGRLRRRFTFSQVALSSLMVQGLLVVALAATRNLWLALPIWACISGLGVLFNINTSSLRQSVVPNEMLGRVLTSARVLAWCAIPLGSVVGGLLVAATHSVSLVYATLGILTSVIAAAFVFSPLGRTQAEKPAEPELAGSVAG
ncbi:MAG TPA: MFS transporter, partial [Acidimicrobiales bacterium]|nr:MFS transporter [Acidimicrobiales bacterium]